MASLEIGDSGPAVRKLQRALKAAGFDPGKIDGDFGAGTEAAVMAYQRDKGLLIDGVAGPRTLKALGLAKSDALESVLDRVTLQVVSTMCPYAPLSNIRKNLPYILAALKAENLVDRPMVLMVIATIRAESGGFEPISEYVSRYNTSPHGHPFDLYDNMSKLGNRGAPDGERYKGRGFVQLTGRNNYKKFGELIGAPLEKFPDRANDPETAARLLAVFIKAREIDIKQALLEEDLKAARKLVNGGSHGLIEFTAAYRAGEALLERA